MTQLVLHPTSTAQWHSLVCEAEKLAQVYLDEDLQSYLVFLLMRFLSKPDIASRVLALDYIQSLLSSGRQQQVRLRDVGDVCLLHAGFFPRRARRKRVSEHYFVELGSGAYQQLSEVTEQGGALYYRLFESFIPIRDLLRSMRALDGAESSAGGDGVTAANAHNPAYHAAIVSRVKH